MRADDHDFIFIFQLTDDYRMAIGSSYAFISIEANDDYDDEDEDDEDEDEYDEDEDDEDYDDEE